MTIADALADPAVTVMAAGPAGAVLVLGVDRFRRTRVPYTEDELREFPPPMRGRLRREGRLELQSMGTADAAVPFRVSAGDTIIVRFQAAAVDAASDVTSARLVCDGQFWGRVEVPVVAVIGRGQATVSCVPERIQFALVPGVTEERGVEIWKPVVGAQVVAVLSAPSSRVRIIDVVASRLERREFTEEELSILPPHAREEMRRVGYEVAVVVGRVQAGQPVNVEAGGMLGVLVSVSAPPPAPIDEVINLNSTLIIESNKWRRIEVPVEPLVGAITMEPSTTHVELRQGLEADGPILHVRSRSGPATTVNLTLGIPGDPWTLRPTVLTLASRRGLSEQLRIAAASTAATGEHRADLKATWFGGLGNLTMPLTLIVRRGTVHVFARQATMAAPQGGMASTVVRVTTSASEFVRFRAVHCPPSVTMLPPDREYFTGGAQDITLRFAVDRYARPHANRRLVVHWDAGDGEQSGLIELRIRIDLVREEKVFSAPIITPDGVPLGGHVSFVLRNDGTGRFKGHMRATGFFSFHFKVNAVVRSANGMFAFMEQETGSVFGTDSPGPQQVEWDRPLQRDAVRYLESFWPDVLSANMTVHRAFEFGGLLGAAVDRLMDALDMLAATAVLAPVPGGSALVLLVLLSSELSDATLMPISTGAGGLVGVVAAAGAAFIVGPSIVFPVFVAGAIAGATAFRHRPVEVHERVFAEEVFGRTLPWDRIRLTNLSGLKGAAFVCPNVDNQILVNLGAAAYERPALARNPDYPHPGQLFIHELTHAWQIGNGGFDARYLWDGIIDKIGGGDYRYGPPGPAFSEFGIEEQASLVDEWFAGSLKNASVPWTNFRPARNEDDPYFRYIAENIRLGRR
ncbi:MAG: hypothetical protein IT170_15800 [Bryobacterales bacterium]|nr:hypothetical protein [Bryobacterales bacterium]